MEQKGDEGRRVEVENTLLLVTGTSFTLNFLIYIQNIYLNQNQTDEEIRFPYSSTEIAFKEDFPKQYEQLWKAITEKVKLDNSYIYELSNEDKKLFYDRLLEGKSEAPECFNQIYKSFQAWWNSLAGSFSLERSIDSSTIGKLYEDLSNLLKVRGKTPQNSLYISLIYDKCLLANSPSSPSFAVLAIEEFFIRYRELVPKLEKSF